MFLKVIEIENFRGIKNLKIEDFGQINILTGENSSGKTSVLEAICELIGGLPIDNLIWMNSLRQPLRQIDISHNFYHKNKTIKIFGKFTENYSREIGIRKNEQEKSDEIKYSSEIIEKLDNVENKNTYEKIFNIIDNNPKSAEINISSKRIPRFFSTVFSSFKVLEHPQFTATLIEAKKDRKISEIVEFLKPVDKRITNIEVLVNDIYLELENFNQLLPIEFGGDGLRRILSIILSIYKVGKGGILVIDEIENGMHFSTMPKLWKSILLAAKELDVQLFITTHNEELLEIFAVVLEGEDYSDFQPKIRYYNLKKYKNDEIVAYKYDFERLDFLLSNGNEIR